MKHDIIDRDTGNIVGVISLSDSSSLSMVMDAELNILHRLISKLDDRLKALEDAFDNNHQRAINNWNNEGGAL